MNFKKRNQGFTILHFIILIAVLAILTAIFYPSFTKATKSVRGSQILSDLRNIENAKMKYHIKYGDYPESYEPSLENKPITVNQKKFLDLIDGKKWPVPPLGEFIIEKTENTKVFQGKTTRRSYYKYSQNSDLSGKENGLSLNNIDGENGQELKLTFLDLLQ